MSDGQTDRQTDKYTERPLAIAPSNPDKRVLNANVQGATKKTLSLQRLRVIANNEQFSSLFSSRAETACLQLVTRYPDPNDFHNLMTTSLFKDTCTYLWQNVREDPINGFKRCC